MNEITNGSVGGFTTREIKDLPGLVAKLRDPANPLGKFLLEKFSEPARQAIAGSDPPSPESEQLKLVLTTELTQVCRGVWIYDPVRFNGISLRTMTQGVLKKNAHGLDLAWLNRLLLQDAFRSEIAPEADTLAAEWVVEGINFRAYCEERPLVKGGIGISYKIVYKTPGKWESKHSKSLEKASKRVKYIASRIHSGAPPLSKSDTKERDAKAQVHDEIAAEVAQLGKHGKEMVDFIKDAVKAQLALGLARPLLAFVLLAIQVMPKPVQRLLLWPAFLRFKAFNLAREGVGKRHIATKNATVERFAKEMPGCEVLGAQLLKSYNLNGDLQAAAPVIETLADQPAPATSADSEPAKLYSDEVSALAILIWLRRLKIGWKARRDALDSVRSFFKYLRDELRAVPQTEKTVAHVVPRPKREGKKTPIPILWFVEVWRILINLQDLESVFFVALGVFAGLHQEEIHRLVWEWDIIWKDGEPHQIFITSGKGKEPRDHGEGKYVDVLFPLNRILMLGRGRTGKIVTNKSLRTTKLMPLVRRLGITWHLSIMRHTCASYMYGAGYTLEDVAKQLREETRTVRLYYLLHIPKLEGERLWTLPVDLSIFENLPDRLREWDFQAPLKPFPAEGECGVVQGLPDVFGPLNGSSQANGETSTDGTATTHIGTPAGMSLAQKSRKASKPRRRYRWPSNLELQVLLWELKQADIASAVGCRQTAVSARAQELGFDTPTPQYWRLKKAGFDVAAMVPESVKQARIALQKLAALAGEQGSSPAQPDNVLALPGTPDDGLVLQAVEPGVTCVSNIS